MKYQPPKTISCHQWLACNLAGASFPDLFLLASFSSERETGIWTLFFHLEVAVFFCYCSCQGFTKVSEFLPMWPDFCVVCFSMHLDGNLEKHKKYGQQSDFLALIILYGQNTFLDIFFSKFSSKCIENTEIWPLRAETLTNSHSTGALAKIENATIHLDKSKWKNNC